MYTVNSLKPVSALYHKYTQASIQLHIDQGHPTSIFGKYLFGNDLRSRIFETFVVKFLACLPLLGFSNI